MFKTREEWHIYLKDPVWSQLHDGPNSGQRGDFLVPSSRRQLLIWPLPWKKQLNNSLIFKIRCSWKMWDRATWVVWRKYPLTHYNLRTCEMSGRAFTSCLLINTGFRLMEHDFRNTFSFPIKCSWLTLLALQYHNYTINILNKVNKKRGSIKSRSGLVF